MLDHKAKLSGNTDGQRRNILFVTEYDELKRQCTEMFQQVKILASNIPYAALIVMARKPDEPVRVCIDYRAINEHTIRDSVPLPRIDDFIDKLLEARCITHIDLRLSYN